MPWEDFTLTHWAYLRTIDRSHSDREGELSFLRRSTTLIAIYPCSDDDDWKQELSEPERIPNAMSLLILHLAEHFLVGEGERGLNEEGLELAGEMARGEKVLVFDDEGERLFGGEGIEVVVGDGMAD